MRRSRHTVIAVAGRPYDFSDADYDGFVFRRRALVRELCESFDVRLVLLRPPSDDARVASEFEALVTAAVSVPAPPASWRTRAEYIAAVAVSGPGSHPWEAELRRAVAALRPDAVVTWGPWLADEYAVLHSDYPAVHFFEEDLTRMVEIAPQSARARWLRAAETTIRRWRLPMPDAVITISDLELAAAKRRYRSRRVFTLPYTLPPGEWSMASAPSDGNEVAVIGAMTNPRQAEGLADVLEHLESQRPQQLSVHVASGPGFDQVLEPYFDSDWIRWSQAVPDVRTIYQRSRAALVPATRATGMKTTILQAWTLGCAVVAHRASARTVGARAQSAMLVGRSGEELAELVCKLWDDDVLRTDLVQRGFETVTANFSQAAAADRLRRLLTELAANGNRGAAR